jgi:germination protein M
MIGSGRASLTLALITVLGVAASACTPTAGPLGTPASPRVTEATSADPGASDVVPATASPAVEPSANPTVAPSGSGETASSGPGMTPSVTAPATSKPTATSIPGATTTLRAYFLTTTADGGIVVIPVLREVPETRAVAAAAMTALLAGPNDTEKAASPALHTTIPAGTKLLGVSITNGVATVNLSREFESGGGSASVFGRLAQVTYTLTQFSTVDSVLFQLDGTPVTTFSGEGVILDHPVGRADFHDQLPAIFLDRPAWGAAAGNPARIAGLANVFEATFRAQVLDGKGTVIADQQVMASCGTGCWGTFTADVPYSVDKAQYGTIRVFDLSARDGSVENLSEYRVWLTPAG